MIEFELPPGAKMTKKMVHGMAEGLFRKIARYYDSYEHEHEQVKELGGLGAIMAAGMGGGGAPKPK